MGINPNTLRHLLLAQKRGCDYEQTLMLGRQTLNLSAKRMAHILRDEFDHGISSDEIANLHAERFADGLFRHLGAQAVLSIDADDYQDASQLHDLNQPVPAEMRQRFSCVLDGGTLEHVFNIVEAFRSAMDMVALGGSFLAVAPINNYLGHGFHQLGHEFFFRALSPEYGFEMVSFSLVDGRDTATWYEMSDPKELGRRAEIATDRPTLAMVHAKRTAVKPILDTMPQQSDYITTWSKNSARRPKRPSRVARAFQRRVMGTPALKLSARYDPAALKPFDPAERYRSNEAGT